MMWGLYSFHCTGGKKKEYFFKYLVFFCNTTHSQLMTVTPRFSCAVATQFCFILHTIVNPGRRLFHLPSFIFHWSLFLLSSDFCASAMVKWAMEKKVVSFLSALMYDQESAHGGFQNNVQNDSVQLLQPCLSQNGTQTCPSL